MHDGIRAAWDGLSSRRQQAGAGSRVVVRRAPACGGQWVGPHLAAWRIRKDGGVPATILCLGGLQQRCRGCLPIHACCQPLPLLLVLAAQVGRREGVCSTPGAVGVPAGACVVGCGHACDCWCRGCCSSSPCWSCVAGPGSPVRLVLPWRPGVGADRVPQGPPPPAPRCASFPHPPAACAAAPAAGGYGGQPLPWASGGRRGRGAHTGLLQLLPPLVALLLRLLQWQRSANHWWGCPGHCRGTAGAGLQPAIRPLLHLQLLLGARRLALRCADGGPQAPRVARHLPGDGHGC